LLGLSKKLTLESNSSWKGTEVPGSESSTELSFLGAKVPGKESSMELLGTFVSGSESFILWNFRSRERKFFGTKVPAFIDRHV